MGTWVLKVDPVTSFFLLADRRTARALSTEGQGALYGLCLAHELWTSYPERYDCLSPWESDPAAYIIKTWRAPQNQRLESWLAHEDINSVMLATSLAPETFLILATPTPSENA